MEGPLYIMRCIRLLILIFTALYFFAYPAYAGPLKAPRLTPGRFVYTIPDNFDPQLIGRHGLEDIQKQTERLHYPYYVVLVKELPDNLLSSVDGDEIEAAARAIDGLAADWQSQSPSFDVGRSSIFLLCYSPRQYRFLAGATWKSRLGFEKGAHEPYTGIFDRSVQGTPKDPKAGIIAMMNAVDAYLFDNIDPARVAAKQAAREKAEHIRVLNDAQSRLDEQIGSLEQLLSGSQIYLPANTSEHRSALEKAKSNRISGNAIALNRYSEDLGHRNALLLQYINKKMAEEKQKELEHGLKIVLFSILSFIIMLILIFRFRNLARLKKSLDTTASAWETKLLNAKSKYADFYGNERDRVAGLSTLTGETKKLYERVTAEVDAIYLGVEAMDSHVAGCRMTAAGASFFNLNPLRKAINSLENEFEFDTGQLDAGNLFGPSTRIIRMKPSDFADDLDNRYAATIAEWGNLKMAAAIRFKTAEEIFPDNRLDSMLNTADEHGIPHRWLRDHPLFGDDAEDREVYNKVNTNRADDPVAFIGRIDDLVATENEIAVRLSALVEAVRMVRENHLDEAPVIGITVLSPQDDPRMTFDSARSQEARFYQSVANPGDSFDVGDISAQAEALQALYRKSVEQAKMVNDAIDNSSNELDRLKSDLHNADTLSINAESRLQDARRVHINTSDAESSLNNGCRFLQESQEMSEKAQSCLNGNRHLDAHASVVEAGKRLDEATKLFELCIAQFEELDRQKRAYDEKMANLEDARRRASSQISRYGRQRNLAEIPNYSTSGPADYYLMLAVLDRLEQDWNNQVRIAQREYNAEQSRIRMEREESERRNRGSSGGFGSGWGGGGSSSSGGSWGGGSSSRGGSSSSSSGGSW